MAAPVAGRTRIIATDVVPSRLVLAKEFGAPHTVNSRNTDPVEAVREHGENLRKTLEVGQTVGVTPVLTAAVDALLVKGARDLAQLVPLGAESFGEAYIGAMVKTHTEVLHMIDHQLLPDTEAEAVTQHLKETRAHVARHLEEARVMQRAMRR